ncbi:MAG TPA: hypothetical protein VLA92_04835, partial [Candidatus Saccharimonadales bacterium]|nr:hypothetical protein [Candidatus Saccharimonadales bacterium]
MSEAAPQLPPAEQGPEQGYSIYHQIQQEREAAEQARLADEQQQQEIARHQQITEDQARAEGAGLPFMHPDKRSALVATANAASVDDLPEMVSDADRRSATRGFHTSHLDASAALNKIKEGARTELGEFDAKRQHAEHTEIQGERHRAGRSARRSATEELESTFEDRFNAAMESHKSLGEGAKAMLATNLREQMKREDAEHAQRVGAKAGQARVNYIEGRGGAEALRDIRDEESLAARVAEEADKLEEKRAWQERMGVGEPRGAKQEGRDSVRISESASEELVRPDGVSGKDWISMNAQQKREAMAEAETDAARV